MTYNTSDVLEHKGQASLCTNKTLGKGLVALVHSTSSIPSRSQGEVVVPVVVVSNLGLPQPLNQLFFHCPEASAYVL